MGPFFDVLNPATGDVVGQAPNGGAAETEQAIAAADKAFATWGKQTVHARGKVLLRWAALLERDVDRLATLLTQEQGKPLAEAKGEILGGADGIRWSVEDAKRMVGETFPVYDTGAQYVTIKQPIGVVAAITPWNFPVAMITRKVAPALAVGCTVVLKPAEDTPLSALAMAELAAEAGLPTGVFNVVTTATPAAVGDVLTASPVVRKLSFTGSTAVGKYLMGQCADTVKKVTLELGGNCPFLIFDDADLDAAVAGVMACKFRNAGQTCNNINRLLVHKPVLDDVVARLTAAVRQLTVGDGLADGTQVGPLINVRAVEKVDVLMAEARAAGATCTVGGKRHALGGSFFEPTVVTGMTSEMAAAKDEIFGPVLAVYPFETEEEGVALANATPYGLTSYFYSENGARCWRVAAALEAGMIAVNSPKISRTDLPFGGVKESGIGRLGGRYAVEEYVEVKSIGFAC